MRITGYDKAFRSREPVLTACLDVSRDGENGEHETELRWQSLREELADSGAPDDVLDRAGELLTAVTGLPGGWGRVVALTRSDVLVDRVFPGRPRAHGRWDSLPHLMPLIDVQSADVPYALVVADRTGADITVSARTGHWEESVTGGDFQISKVNVGGWSHRRYQHRAENLWEANAGEVADRLDHVVATAGVELVAVAGDVRATQLVRDTVSSRTREILHVLDAGARNEGAADQPLEDEVTSLREHLAVERARASVNAFLEQQGRGGRAAAGLGPTVEALRRGQVDVLLVPQGWDDHEPAWFGEEPPLLALKQDELTSLGVQDPRQAPVSDVVVRAAVGTDAQLVVVPEFLLTMHGEPAALLRFTDDSTPHGDDEENQR